jgi:hypothetical protein
LRGFVVPVIPIFAQLHVPHSVQIQSEPVSWYAKYGYPDFGSIAGRAGDVDGDGIPDLLVGDPGDDRAGERPSVWVLSGMDGTVLRVAHPPSDAERAYSVEGGVDVDGDYVPDFLVASHSYRNALESEVDIVSGKTGSIVRSIATGGSAWGPGSWARLVADADSDGRPDVAVLILEEGENSGTVRVYSSRTGAIVTQFRIANPAMWVQGGFMQVGDVDGDGVADIAVVLAGQGEHPAILSVYSMASGKRVWDFKSTPKDQCYAAFALLGDIDRDRVRDFAVSFDDEVDIVLGGSGRRFLAIGPGVRADSDQGFGWGLAALGDIDSDGFVDFAVSSIDMNEFSYGAVIAKSGKDGHTLWISAHKQEEDTWHLGYQLAALGDIDGDGFTDLVLGTWAGAAGQPGEARVLSGRTGALLFQFRRKGDEVVVTGRGK